MQTEAIFNQSEIARKQLTLLRLKQRRVLGTLDDAIEWQGRWPLRAFMRVCESQFQNYIDARREAKVAGAVIFG